MADKVRIGMIGCGGMMGAHRDGYRTLWEHDYRDFEITATCDIDAGRAEGMANSIGEFQGSAPKVYTDVQEMLDKEPGLDAVDICTLHSMHHVVAVPALEAGKHVTIEKPLGITMRACRQILDAAEKNDRLLQVAENYRRDPNQRATRWGIEQGKIGEPRCLFWVDIGESLGPWGWRDDKFASGGGWAMDGGVHYTDLMRFYLGCDVEEVYAISKAYHPYRYHKPDTLEDRIEVTNEDTVVAILKFEHGITAQWTIARMCPGGGLGGHALYGSKGRMSLTGGFKSRDEEMNMDQLREAYMASLSDAERERWFPRGITHTVATELHEFIETVLGRGELEIDGIEGMKDVAICFAAYESGATGQAVKMSDIESCKIEVYQGEINEALDIR